MTIVGEVPSVTLQELPERTCARCRKSFPGDPTLFAPAIAEWWACGPCRASLGLAPDPAAPSC